MLTQVISQFLSQFVKKGSQAVRLGLILGIVLAATALPAQPALAQLIPPGCRNDAGQPVEPGPIVGSWVAVLNFNHASITGKTTGCVIYRVQGGGLVYDEKYECTTLGDTGQATTSTVGGGSVKFDGSFSLSCPGQPLPAATQTLFYVETLASLGRGSNQSIISHPSYDFGIDVTETAKATLTTSYNGIIGSANKTIGAFINKQARYESYLVAKKGRHFFNGPQIGQPFNVPVFVFVQAESFAVGGVGETFEMFELIFDPSGSCCRS